MKENVLIEKSIDFGSRIVMYWASQGYLWEQLQRGSMDAGAMERDFERLIDFWRSVYLRKEGGN